MKKKLFIGGTIYLLLGAGSNSYATIYAVAKLSKSDKTIYVLSDVNNETSDASIQKKVIIEQAKLPDTLLIARDPLDVRRYRDFIPVELHGLFVERQKVAEKTASQFNEVRMGLITMVQAAGIETENMHFYSLLGLQGLPFAAAKFIVGELIEVLKDHIVLLPEAEKKVLTDNITFLNKIDKKPVSAEGLKKFNDLLKSLEQLYALKSINAATKSRIFMCGTPQDAAYIARSLSLNGWVGDITNVIKFEASQRKVEEDRVIRDARTKQKMEEFAKLQESLKKLKNKNSRKKLLDIFSKKWGNELAIDVPNFEHGAGQQPIDPMALCIDVHIEPVHLATPSTSTETLSLSEGCSTPDVSGTDAYETASAFNFSALISHDAYARMRHALEIQRCTNVSIMQQEEKVAFARQVLKDLWPILELDSKSFINTYEHELAYMQIHACEIMAYFDAHVGNEVSECTSLVNALVAAQNDGLFVISPNGVQFPYHKPATIQRLVYLMETPKNKEHVCNMMASKGLSADEQTTFFAELYSYAAAYKSQC